MKMTQAIILTTLLASSVSMASPFDAIKKSMQQASSTIQKMHNEAESQMNSTLVGNAINTSISVTSVGSQTSSTSDTTQQKTDDGNSFQLGN